MTQAQDFTDTERLLVYMHNKFDESGNAISTYNVICHDDKNQRSTSAYFEYPLTAQGVVDDITFA